MDWRLSRPVLIISVGEVSDKCARIHEFYFSLDPRVADDLRPTTDQGRSPRSARNWPKASATTGRAGDS
jgi:hypothetical protein